ncbi:MAG: hypothetical protein ACOH2M_10225 [Cypionkella sp.]
MTLSAPSTFRRRKNRPHEAASRERPIPYAGPPRAVLAARLEDHACEALRRRGLDPDRSRLGLSAPGWTHTTAVVAILEALDDYLTAHDAGGPGYWNLGFETDDQGRPVLLLVNDVWTTASKVMSWSPRLVEVDGERVAFRAPNAARRIARAVAVMAVGLLVPATAGGRAGVH